MLARVLRYSLPLFLGGTLFTNLCLAQIAGGGTLRSFRGAAYSAEQTDESLQTLADGTQIKQVTGRDKIYRDSQGRTRTERTPILPGPSVSQLPVFVTIVDPVAGCTIVLNEKTHTATRTNFSGGMSRGISVNAGRAPQIPPAAVLGGVPPPPPPPPSVSAPGANNRPQSSSEKLGTQTIEGMAAEGTRITTVYPEGFFGNDRPIAVVREMWRSRELEVILLSKTIDPRFGERTVKLTDIQREEPDPALFQIPPDYTVEDKPAMRLAQ